MQLTPMAARAEFVRFVWANAPHLWLQIDPPPDQRQDLVALLDQKLGATPARFALVPLLCAAAVRGGRSVRSVVGLAGILAYMWTLRHGAPLRALLFLQRAGDLLHKVGLAGRFRKWVCVLLARLKRRLPKLALAFLRPLLAVVYASLRQIIPRVRPDARLAIAA
jgi:hypothetical protein